MSAGYTYTTITSGADEPVQITVAFHLDDTVWIRVCGQEEDRPQLCIRHGDVGVHFVPAPGPVTETDARTARDLADKAATYAAEVERLHTQQNTQAATGTAA
jgi:hypothetical protein